jgi:hypothetical protein
MPGHKLKLNCKGMNCKDTNYDNRVRRNLNKLLKLGTNRDHQKELRTWNNMIKKMNK